MTPSPQPAAASDHERGEAAWRRFLRHPFGLAGLTVLGVVATAAAAAPLLPLPDPAATDLARRLLPPLAAGHPLGTDELGRDLLARLVWGGRVSLAVGLFATLVATLTGTLIGIVAAYYGRLLDTLLMRGIDVLMAFPYLLLALAIVAALGPGLTNAMLAIAVVNVPFFARAVRGATLSLTKLDYVAAARLAGYGDLRILCAELLPNVLPAIVIMMSTTIGWMILETAGLSFLGLGAQPPRADLGSMLGGARELLTTAPHVVMIPGLAIFVIVVAINLVGDGVRDALDPRLKGEQRGGTRAPSHPQVPPLRHTEMGTGGEARERHGEDDALLRVEGLSTCFFVGDDVYRAVEEVSFTLAPGEALGVVGESGCGKSVTALSLLGLVPDPPGRIVSGTVAFRDEDLTRATPTRLRALRGDRISYIPQDPMSALNPVLTVGEQVAETVRAHRAVSWAEARDRAAALLDLVRLPESRRRLGSHPHELSGGMRQRVLIAMALANEPDIVIADEPTTALDVTIQAQILALLRSLTRERGTALVFITHDLGIVGELCDRVLVMYAGRVVEAAPIATIFRDPRHPYTRRLLAAVPLLGRPERPMRPIPGLPPPVHHLPPGCHFAPRCEFVLDACREPPITLEPVGRGHAARCIRAREDVVRGPVR